MKKTITLTLLSLAMLIAMASCAPKAPTSTPVASTPVASTPVESTPVESTPVESTPGPSSVAETVSDDTFKLLQDTYAKMFENYNLVKEHYESDEVKSDAAAQAVIANAADLVNQMAEVNQAEISQADAVALNNSMVTVVDALSVLADAIAKK